ncbi:MAG: DUF4910 domain-containing protein [Saprospiraceae bacterium]|nr:DUF4910 domain-containing protein [Saprospiraceae bacterium]
MEHNSIGDQIYELAKQLYPICRSITGNGVRQTLEIISKHIPLEVHEVPTGMKVLDWIIPKEWNIVDAWIKDPNGRKIIDFQNHNLHVLNYSIPLRQKMELEVLQGHLYSIPEQPDVIPYRTSYYKEQWGFCLSHRQRESLIAGEYEVCIESTLEPGSLTYAEYLVRGQTDKEFLFTTHICHPSLANDNVSGMAVLANLANHLDNSETYYSYRFLFIPGTIGSITWLDQNQNILNNIKGGIVVAGVGDDGHFHYKCSRRGTSAIDRICNSQIANHSGQLLPFSPYGYDERQFCSPGFNLAIGNISKSVWGTYPEYHTSSDNLDFISAKGLAGSLQLLIDIIKELDSCRFYINSCSRGEPQLGRRGLYSAIGGKADVKSLQMAMLWALNLSDGDHDLKAMEERSGVSQGTLEAAIELLCKSDLLTVE